MQGELIFLKPLPPLITYSGGRWRKRLKDLYRCFCGNEFETSTYHVKTGNTKSCGCIKGLKHITHGRTKTVEWKCWSGIKRRCYDTNCKAYPDYGGRGIKVCDRWKNSFETFLEDMGERPSEKHSLDRIDVNGDYCPSNCRWVTRKTQNRNKRNNRLLNFRGELKSMAEWVEELNLCYDTVRCRLDRGWDVDKALTHPVRKMKKPGEAIER